jgi:exodeoxyribonuclease V alpha subunit
MGINAEGLVENIIFYNEENSYAVFSLATSDNEDDEPLMCVGYVPGITMGENIKITGTKVIHPTYGEQINVEVYEKTMPKSEKGIERYLSSGVIKGLGKRTAKRIVEKFGEDTLKIMEKQPEKLAEIRGISIEKARHFSAVFKEQSELRNAMLYLQNYGISPSYCMKIYKKYKEKTIETVQQNPYTLADDIFGIGFRIADEIAANVGIDKNSPFRIRAGVKYILNMASSNGHIYLPQNVLLQKTSEMLSLDPEIIQNELKGMHIENYLWLERDGEDVRVYLNYYYYSESFIARSLVELSRMETFTHHNYDDEIDLLEISEKIEFAPNQRLAVKAAMENGVLVITGGPGTGKTTIINAIIKLAEAEGNEIKLAAPTGRAAKRMTEATGHEAQTIHRLLGINFAEDASKRQNFERDEDNPLEADIIIIDESSMVDNMLMFALLKAVDSGTRLILVGDANQLPSVGAGNVLKDIIASGVVKVVYLNEIFRQAQESAIIMNAHKINKGEYPDITQKDKDFFFMKRYDPKELISTLMGLVSSRLPNYMNCNAISDIQVLTPMRKSPLGVINLNTILQETLNPPHPNKREKQFHKSIFREGDKVMQIKNNYNMEWRLVEKGVLIEEGQGVYNGDCGIVNYIDLDNEYVEVTFDDNRVVQYDYSQIDELELSYAVTIHKSQGSEYKVVVLPVHSGPEMLMTRNLLYTALTRAKELAVIVGSPEMLFKMVDNNKEVDRYTTLSRRMREFDSI